MFDKMRSSLNFGALWFRQTDKIQMGGGGGGGGGGRGLPTAPSPLLNFFQGAFAGRKAIELILGRTESLGRVSPICKRHKWLNHTKGLQK